MKKQSGNPLLLRFYFKKLKKGELGKKEKKKKKKKYSIFNASTMRHTSESVISEIENFKSLMSEFGRDLNIVLSRNKIKDLRKFREAMFQGYNENQGIFIKQFLEIVITRNEEVIVSEYRATRREVESKIGAVLETKTQKPLIPISKDQGFIDSLVCIEDEDDRQIVADAVLWATGYDSTIFCTSDSVHILTSSPAIKSTINSYYH